MSVTFSDMSIADKLNTKDVLDFFCVGLDYTVAVNSSGGLLKEGSI